MDTVSLLLPFATMPSEQVQCLQHNAKRNSSTPSSARVSKIRRTVTKLDPLNKLDKALLLLCHKELQKPDDTFMSKGIVGKTNFANSDAKLNSFTALVKHGLLGRKKNDPANERSSNVYWFTVDGDVMANELAARASDRGDTDQVSE
jgi:hypothetical protein